ncbi:MAG: hypothetical protein NC430_03960 [bacterium]|nr:hypothetical protein [bacterium]MCM1424272.1 hypothetical protein [bacterium]
MNTKSISRYFRITEILEKRENKYRDSISRSYYAIFTAVRAVFQIRNSCDYDDFFIASRQDAEEQYSRAAEFYQEVLAYLSK